MVDDRLLGDETRESVMGLDDLDSGGDLEQLPQTAAAVLGHGQLLAELLVNLACFLASSVGDLDQFASKAGEEIKDVGTNDAFRAALPVVTVDDVIGPELFDDGVVEIVVLDDDPGDALKGLVEPYPLVLGDGWELVVANERLVAEGSQDDLAIPLGIPDDVQVSLVDDVGAERGIDNCHAVLLEIGAMRLNAADSSK